MTESREIEYSRLYLSGLTYIQIAKMMNVTKGTVAGVLRSAREKGVCCSRSRGLDAIGRLECRWPIGEKKPFLFCGSSINKYSDIYCEAHRKIAYKKQMDRK